MGLKSLDKCQLEVFNCTKRPLPGYIYSVVKECIDEDFPDGEFRFLDMGGGVGRLTDKILDEFPKSRGLVLDNSEYLLSKNRVHNRKTLLCASAQWVDTIFADRRFDIVFIHDLLHHLVCETYKDSRQAILNTLVLTKMMLSSCGRVSVWENLYSGAIVDSLPSHIIFHVTSSKLLCRLTKRLGANTAGVGACFLSEKQWHTVLNNAGLRVLKYKDVNQPCLVSPCKKILLHIGSYVAAHFWCANSQDRNVTNDLCTRNTSCSGSAKPI